MAKLIAVTGGTGFIGFHLVKRLVADRFAVNCLVLPGERYEAVPGVRYFCGDITDSSSMGGFLDGIDAVIHLAGLTRARTDEEFLRVNADSATMLINEASRRSKSFNHIIAMSSLAAVGPSADERGVCEDDPLRPISPYGKSKARLEELLRYKESMADWTVIRAPAVYGPGDRDFLAFFRLIQNGWRVVIGRRSLLSLVYDHNLVEAIVRCLEHPGARNNAFFIADRGIYDWDQLGAIIETYFGRRTRRIHVPFWAVRMVAAINQLRMPFCRSIPLLNKHKLAEMSQAFWVVSTEKARLALGYVPAFETVGALHETGRWYREMGWL